MPFSESLTLFANEDVQSKLDLLKQFNLQIVACLHISEQVDGLDVRSIEGVSYTVSHQDENEFFPETRNELLFYAFIRDVHYTDGLYMITPSHLSQSQLSDRLGRINAISPVTSKLFSVPQQFIMKPELVDDILASLISINAIATEDVTLNGNNNVSIGQDTVKHILTDLLL